MKIFTFLKDAVTDSKTNMPSTKRLGHVVGLFTTAFVAFVITALIVGLCISIPAGQYQFVFTTLSNTLMAIIAILTAGGTTAYIKTKQTEGKVNDDGGP